jgi:hypothetical protein
LEPRFAVICTLKYTIYPFLYFSNSIEWPLEQELNIPVEQCLRVYKSAFLLNRLNHAAFGKLFIPVGKFLMLTFDVNVPAFAIFCYWDSLDLPSISTLLVLMCLSGPMLVSSALVMSGIYDISSQFQRNMREKIQLCCCGNNESQREVWLKELRSCQVARCQIGNFYHMEGKAKLTLVNTMLNIFVFMIVERNVL